MKIFLYINLLFFILGFGCQSRENQAEKEAVSTDTVVQDTARIINRVWEGTWEREGSIDPAVLTISNVSYSSFDFHITTHDGLTASEFSGKATLEDNLALYISAGIKDTCHANFILQDSLVLVNHANEGCSETSGLIFSGEYYEERFFKEKVMEEDAAARKLKK